MMTSDSSSVPNSSLCQLGEDDKIPPARARSLYGFICSAFVIGLVLCSRPYVEIGATDDWSYAQIAGVFAKTGHVVYNGWNDPTLGWMLVWTAPFIKLLGYSYQTVRLSMLPLSFLTLFLFNQVLLRFGLTPVNAAFGVLTLGLCGPYLFVSSAYMTDLPFLLTIVACIYLCQRALSAESLAATLGWLLVAAVTGLVGGTARQVGFLGVLVIVPSTGYLLRNRRYCFLASLLFAAVSAALIAAYLHWFNRQPFTPASSTLSAIRSLSAFTTALVRALSDSTLAILPLLILFSVFLLRVRRSVFFAGTLVLAVMACVLTIQGKLAVVSKIMLKLHLTPTVNRVVLIYCFLALSGVALYLIQRKNSHRYVALISGYKGSLTSIAILLGPFSFCYFGLLVPRMTTGFFVPRYLLGLMPVLIIFLLKLYQDKLSARPSALGWTILCITAYLGFADNFWLFSHNRAILQAANLLRSSGIPRTEIGAGFEYNSETQLMFIGHINEPRIKTPSNAYAPRHFPAGLSLEAEQLVDDLDPVVQPKYFLLDHPTLNGLIQSKYSPVRFTTLVPPFHQVVYVLVPR